MMIIIELQISFQEKIRYWFWGNIVRQLFLKILAHHSEELLSKLHGSYRGTLAPYAVEPIIAKNRMVITVHPNRRYTVRIKILDPSLLGQIIKALEDTPDRTYIIENIAIKIHEVTIEGIHPEKIEPPNHKIRFILISPTTFKPAGSPWLDPIPSRKHIVASLTRLWNTFIQQKYEKTHIESIANKIKITGINLRTAPPIPIGKNRKIIGTTGYILMDIQKLDKEERKLLALAQITNIGKNRTYGLGTIRITKENTQNKTQSPKTI